MNFAVAHVAQPALRKLATLPLSKQLLRPGSWAQKLAEHGLSLAHLSRQDARGAILPQHGPAGAEAFQAKIATRRMDLAASAWSRHSPLTDKTSLCCSDRGVGVLGA